MNNNALDALNRAAMDTFDPSEMYDPNGFDSYTAQTGRAGSKVIGSPARNIKGKLPEAQFDLQINFADKSSDTIIELFNAQYSVSKYTTYAPANYYPVDAVHSATIGVEAWYVYGRAIDYAIGHTNIWWGQDGELRYSSADGIGKIQCSQIPYRALVDQTLRSSLTINRMRIKYGTSGQINNDITWTNKTFLGMRQQNSISPASYFAPDQYQSLIVDVPVTLPIDADKGLTMTVNANENMLVSIFVSQYTRNTI
jgi:hypothetical protein